MSRGAIQFSKGLPVDFYVKYRHQDLVLLLISENLSLLITRYPCPHAMYILGRRIQMTLISDKKNTKVLLHLPRAGPICALAHISWSILRMCEICARNSVHTCTWNLNAIYHEENPSQNSKNYIFYLDDLDLWPMTLTFEPVQDTIEVNPCTKFHDCTPNGSAVRVLTDRHTDTQTDGSVFITLTADAGGNKL